MLQETGEAYYNSYGKRKKEDVETTKILMIIIELSFGSK